MNASLFSTTKSAAAGGARAASWKFGRGVYAFLVVFFVTVVKRVNLPEMFLPTAHAGLRAATDQGETARRLSSADMAADSRVAALGQVSPAGYDPLRVAFYVSWDPSSLASLQQHYRDIDLLVPEQLHSISPDGRLDVTERSEARRLDAVAGDRNSHDAAAEQFRRHDLAHSGDGGDAATIPTARQHLVQQAVARLQARSPSRLGAGLRAGAGQEPARFHHVRRRAGRRRCTAPI